MGIHTIQGWTAIVRHRFIRKGKGKRWIGYIKYPNIEGTN